MLCNNPKLDLVNMNDSTTEKLELSENLTIAPLQCFAWSKRPEFLRILSGNVILTSIKSNNSYKCAKKDV